MRHAGEVVTRQQVLDAVWGADPDVYSNVVDLYVHYLRQKLETAGPARRTPHRPRRGLLPAPRRTAVKLRGGPVDPAEALLRRTRIRLALLTLATVTTLVIVIGVTTAVTAITLMRESVDRALLLAAGDPLVLHQLFDGEGEDGSVQGVLGDADTFVILASADGALLGASGARPEGLPDTDAIAAAERARDLRDARIGDTDVRLLTMRVAGETSEDHESEEDDEESEADASTRFLQAGMNMALQHRLERQLLLAIFAIGALGVLGAMVVTLFVTQRALVPIREAFATERRFVAAASHELQTPVAIIRASAEILERERLVAGDGTALVDDIIGETDRLGRLVSDLLALASAEAGAISSAQRPSIWRPGSRTSRAGRQPSQRPAVRASPHRRIVSPA